MALARTSTGAFVNGLAGITPLFNTGAAAGNLGILLVETANEAVTTPSSWTSLGFPNVGSAGVAGGTRQTLCYRPSITSGEVSGGIAVADSGDHQLAALLTYSGHDATTPLVASGAFSATPATTSVSLNNFNTTIATGDIVLAIIATDRDSATISTNTSATWTGVTGTSSGFILNGSTSTGAGGGIIVHELVATANFTGQVNFSCSITSSIWAGWIVVVKQAATSINGTLAKTLGAVTSSSNANLKIAGTLAKTLNTVTLSDTANLLIKGSLAKTLSSVTLAAAQGRVGTLAKTLDALTLTAASKLKIVGTLSKTLGAVTSSSAANLLVKGSVSKTLGTLTLSSTSKLQIKGTLAKTLATTSLSSAGTLKLKGSLTETLAAVTLTSAAKLKLSGTVTATLATLTSSETGVLKIKGTLSKTLGSLSLSSSGIHVVAVAISAQVNKTLALVQSAATSNLLIKGSLRPVTLTSLTTVSESKLKPFIKLITRNDFRPYGIRYKRRN